MRRALLALLTCGAAMFGGCLATRSPPRPAPVPAPLVVATGDVDAGAQVVIASDFVPVLEACDDTSVHRVGSDVLVVRLRTRKSGEGVTVSIARWDAPGRMLVDPVEVDVPEIEPISDVMVLGRSIADARVVIHHNCAPAMQEIECLEATIVRKDGRFVLAQKPRWTPQGTYVDRGYLPPGAKRHPFLVPYESKHPGCSLGAPVETVRTPAGAFTFAYGCSQQMGTKPCPGECVLITQREGRKATTEVVYVSNAAVAQGLGALLVTAPDMAAANPVHLELLDANGRRPARLPRDATAPGEIWADGAKLFMQTDDAVMTSDDAITWTSLCPTPSCRPASRSALGLDWLWEIEEHRERALHHRRPGAGWERLVWPGGTPADVVLAPSGHLFVSVRDHGITWLRTGGEGARYTCTDEGFHLQ